MTYTAGHEINLLSESANLDICEGQNIDNISEDHVIKTTHESETKVFHQKLTNEMQSMSRLKVYHELNNAFDLEIYIKSEDATF